VKKVYVLFVAVIFVSTIFGQQKVAIYVTGEKDKGIDKELSHQLLEALNRNRNKYIPVERQINYNDIVKSEICYQHSGFVADEEIVCVGKQFGAELVCVGEVRKLFGDIVIEARFIDVLTVEIKGTASERIQNNLLTAANVENGCKIVAAKLVGEKIKINPPPKATEEKVKEEISPKASTKTYHYWGISAGYVAKKMDINSPFLDSLQYVYGSNLWDSSKYVNGIKFGIRWNPIFYKYKSMFRLGLDFGIYGIYFSKNQTNDNLLTKFNEWTLSIPFHLEPRIRIGPYSDFFISAGTSMNIGLKSRFFISSEDPSNTIYKNQNFYGNSELGSHKKITFPLEFGAGFTFYWFQIRGNIGFNQDKSISNKYNFKKPFFETTLSYRPTRNIIEAVEFEYHFLGLFMGYAVKKVDIVHERWDTSSNNISGINFGLRDQLTFSLFDSEFGFGLDLGVYANFFFKNQKNTLTKYREWILKLPLHFEPKYIIDDFYDVFISVGTSINIPMSIKVAENKNIYNNPVFGNPQRVKYPLELGAGFTVEGFQMRVHFGLHKGKFNFFEVMLAFAINEWDIY